MATSKKEKKDKTEKTSLKILFIGNSFTQHHDLPGLIAQIAAAHGEKIEHRLITIGGASLRTHWNKGEAMTAMEEEHYDYVVLQEQSTLPVKNAQRMGENVALFDEEIKRAGSKTALYLTWARSYEPDNQKLISDAYMGIGKELGALVIPVGLAWEKFLQKHTEPELHAKDMSHPALAGSYLAACVFFAMLFSENPTGAEDGIAGLSAEDKALLQKTAWEVCKKTERK